MLALGNLITNKVQAGFYFFLTFSGKFPPAAKIHYLSIKYSKAFILIEGAHDPYLFPGVSLDRWRRSHFLDMHAPGAPCHLDTIAGVQLFSSPTFPMPIGYKTQNQLHPQLPPIALAGGRKL